MAKLKLKRLKLPKLKKVLKGAARLGSGLGGPDLSSKAGRQIAGQQLATAVGTYFGGPQGGAAASNLVGQFIQPKSTPVGVPPSNIDAPETFVTTRPPPPTPLPPPSNDASEGAAPSGMSRGAKIALGVAGGVVAAAIAAKLLRRKRAA